MKRKFSNPDLALIVALPSISTVALPSAAMADGSYGFGNTEASLFFGNQRYHNNSYAYNQAAYVPISLGLHTVITTGIMATTVKLPRQNL